CNQTPARRAGQRVFFGPNDATMRFIWTQQCASCKADSIALSMAMDYRYLKHATDERSCGCDAGRATPSPLNRPALTRYYRPARSFFKFGAQPTTQETDDSGTLGKFHDPHVSEQPAVDFRVLLAGDSSFRLFRESGDQRGHLGPRKQSFCRRPI